MSTLALPPIILPPGLTPRGVIPAPSLSTCAKIRAGLIRPPILAAEGHRRAPTGATQPGRGLAAQPHGGGRPDRARRPAPSKAP